MEIRFQSVIGVLNILIKNQQWTTKNYPSATQARTIYCMYGSFISMKVRESKS